MGTLLLGVILPNKWDRNFFKLFINYMTSNSFLLMW